MKERGKRMNVTEVKEMIPLNPRYWTYTPEQWIEMICAANGTTYKAINTTCRKRELVEIRQYCFWFLWQYLGLSLKSIGNLFGSKDHSTVIHGRDAIVDFLSSNDKRVLTIHNSFAKSLNDEENVLEEVYKYREFSG